MCKTSLQNKCVLIIGDKRCIISDHSDNKIIKQIKMEPVEQSKIQSGNITFQYIYFNMFLTKKIQCTIIYHFTINKYKTNLLKFVLI